MPSVKDWRPDSEDPEKVIFRKYYDGEIVALFPELPADYEGKYCISFAHIGQHGSADCDMVMRNTIPASTKEYEKLFNELMDRGYELDVIERPPRNAHISRRNRAAGFSGR